MKVIRLCTLVLVLTIVSSCKKELIRDNPHDAKSGIIIPNSLSLKLGNGHVIQDNNNNGIIEGGEMGEIQFYIKNTSNRKINYLKIISKPDSNFSYPNSFSQNIDSQIVTNVGVGDSISIIYTVSRIDDAFKANYNFPIEFSCIDDYGNKTNLHTSVFTKGNVIFNIEKPKLESESIPNGVLDPDEYVTYGVYMTNKQSTGYDVTTYFVDYVDNTPGANALDYLEFRPNNIAYLAPGQTAKIGSIDMKISSTAKKGFIGPIITHLIVYYNSNHTTDIYIQVP